MKKFIFLLILFSVGIMGQVVVTNPFETGNLTTTTTPIYVTSPNGVTYIDPCSTTQNACIWDSHSSCVYDGSGEYHCECNVGYKHSDENNNKSACVDICDNSNCSSYGNNIECTSHLIEGQAVCKEKSDAKAQKCIDDPNSSSCGGVLLCSGENLTGVCKVFTESTNNFNYTWYNDSNGNAVRTLPKSAVPINSNWEIYAPKESFFSNPYGLYQKAHDKNLFQGYYSGYKSNYSGIYDFSIKSETVFFNESEEQNKIMDNADLVFQVSHGSWDKGLGASWSIMNPISYYFEIYNYDTGKFLGNYETEWLLSAACESLGDKRCKKCSYGYNYYDSDTGESEYIESLHFDSISECEDYRPTCIEETSTDDYTYCSKCSLNGTIYTNSSICVNNIHKNCEAYYVTSETMVMKVYLPLFANGLHGFGGFYKDSYWPGTYTSEGKSFWQKIINGKSIAYSWLKTLGYYKSKWFQHDIERYAAYIAPGPCHKYVKNGKKIYSYIHDDHFWGYGLTLSDPDKTFIKNEGFCYYAWNDWANRHYNFNNVIPVTNNDWYVLTSEENFLDNETIITNINSIIKDKNSIFKDNNLISYENTSSDNFIEIKGSESYSPIYNYEISDNLIQENYDIVNNLYKLFFDEIVKKNFYEIIDINYSAISSQHYNASFDRVGDVSLYEIIFRYSLSYNGHTFMDGNYIEIGVNPLTHEITTINSNINKLIKTKEIIKADKINNDLNKLVSDTTYKYIATYIKVDNEYRPAILLKEDGVKKIQVVKVY